ncbi:MAG TPA: hypothetical protein V6C81_31990 [Planktothrix sp.]|jgi:hypothetical protein
MSAETTQRSPEFNQGENSVSESVDHALHNPLVDVGIAAAIGVGILASRGKIAPMCEKLFPKAQTLLDGIEDGVPRASVDTALERASLSVDPNLLGRDVSELRPMSWQTMSPAVLSKLAEHSDQSILGHVATNPAASSEALAKVLENPNVTSQIEESVAQHPNASPMVLARLAQAHPRLVAAHVATSTETLSTLRLFDDFVTNRSIAAHANASSEVLSSLARDTDPYVLKGIGTNSNTGLDTLQHLPYRRLDRSVSEFLSMGNFRRLLLSPSTPRATLTDIADARFPVLGMPQTSVRSVIYPS